MQEIKEVLRPGTVIELADITELPKVEDTIAFAIDPKLDADAWATRENARDIVRPPKFQGRIANIVLEVMEEPYEQLRSARERGWQFAGGGSHHGKRSTDVTKRALGKYVGLQFVGEAYSTGRGMIGQIQAEMWYLPIAGRAKNGKLLTNAATEGGRSVKRFITRPRYEKEQFIPLRNVSRRIGYEILRAELSSAVVTASTGHTASANRKKY